ncbi:VOC family protein [Candidatus Eisenbacteria bacterium]|uniref:VOC family protein n=1 Tax=Eiseniibacteriota bacterium TaxID=2212470 RepID=A0ABV6YM55_UNCEI
MNLSFAEVQTFVSDLWSSREFYAGVLGLKLVRESDRWLIFSLNGSELVLMEGARPAPPRGPYGTECGTVVCLLSDDIQRDYDALKSCGVRFLSEITEVAEGKYVGFQDPDGNLLELIQK